MAGESPPAQIDQSTEPYMFYHISIARASLGPDSPKGVWDQDQLELPVLQLNGMTLGWLHISLIL